MIAGTIASIIGGIILMVLGILLKVRWWSLIKRKILLGLTDNNLTGICEYNIAKEKMERLLSDPKVIKWTQPALKIMCVKGKDITGELERGIKTFLRNGGAASVLLLDPNSKYTEKRARELGREDIDKFRASIRRRIDSIKDEYHEWYSSLGTLCINTYDSPYTFRMNFIDETLFLGFYREKLPDYENVWYEIPSHSELYKILVKLFDEIRSEEESV